ncbi:hypothetical protein TcasGA2_TC010190 [Tribolium castaneum]|uniref:Uncharacterized protein n=1 Tax=Tribolium castaneum TaxID=7070 RepID=D6WTI9_TRICA|nr:hypothetical protein TcasGA2_TC010190 [Tribolium castaneum]
MQLLRRAHFDLYVFRFRSTPKLQDRIICWILHENRNVKVTVTELIVSFDMHESRDRHKLCQVLHIKRFFLIVERIYFHGMTKSATEEVADIFIEATRIGYNTSHPSKPNCKKRSSYLQKPETDWHKLGPNPSIFSGPL